MEMLNSWIPPFFVVNVYSTSSSRYLISNAASTFCRFHRFVSDLRRALITTGAVVTKMSPFFQTKFPFEGIVALVQSRRE